MSGGGWHPALWRERPAAQQPVYADAAALAASERALAEAPPLVLLEAVEALRAELAEAAAGRALLLQGGDCAETFAEADVAGLAALFDSNGGLMRAEAKPAIRSAANALCPRQQSERNRQLKGIKKYRANLKVCEGVGMTKALLGSAATLALLSLTAPRRSAQARH